MILRALSSASGPHKKGIGFPNFSFARALILSKLPYSGVLLRTLYVDSMSATAVSSDTDIDRDRDGVGNDPRDGRAACPKGGEYRDGGDRGARSAEGSLNLAASRLGALSIRTASSERMPRISWSQLRLPCSIF